MNKKELQTTNLSLSNIDWIDAKFVNPNATIRVGTLFSGIGAFEHAFERLNLRTEIVFAGDIDRFVKQSYFANHDIKEENWHDDITKFSATKYRDKVDILIGGSPCQSFSMAGKRGGLSDTRGTLFYDFARVVDECKPKVFIFENVKGLLSHDKGNTWKVVLDVFEELGYKLNYKVLNSRNYGIPQQRNRIFVVGFKDKDIEFEFPKEIPLEYRMQDFLEDYIDSKYYLKEQGVKFITDTSDKEKRFTQITEGEVGKKFNEFIFDVATVEEKYYLSEKMKICVLSPGTKNFKTSTETDLEVARTLLQSMHKMHRAGLDNYVTHAEGRIRKLTPRECLRLMGFRDSFKITVSNTQMYRQAGNSIVVDVLIALLKQMDITKFSEN